MNAANTLPDAVVNGERSIAADVETVDATRGTILMRAAPYDHEVELVPGVFESFAPGTFARAADAPHRVKMFHEHSTNPRGRLIGHATSVEDRDDGLWIEAKFSNTIDGQEARELARDGTLDQVSVEFRPMPEWIKQDRRADGLHIRHARAYLKGVALVPHGAYSDQAMILSVRDADAEREREAVERARREAIERLNAFVH